MPTEFTILCEGYYDRAFWKGCLLRAGCRDASLEPDGNPIRGRVVDLDQRAVVGGQYGFWTATGNFIRVVPCHGKPAILPEARNRLNRRLTEPISRLVLNIDPDTDPHAAATGLRLQDVEASLKTIDSTAAINAEGDVALDQGKFLVSLVRWEVADPTPSLPTKQCLERLICSCLHSAYPDRTDPVSRWLNTRPAPPPDDPKQFVWSHMAGWYAGMGCEFFFQNLWKDDKLASEMQDRLQASGAWRVVEELVK